MQLLAEGAHVFRCRYDFTKIGDLQDCKLYF